MRATAFEFRFRFLIICAIFAIGFACSFFDSVNATRAWVGFVTRAVPDRRALRLGFAADATVAALAALLRTWATAYLAGSVVHDSRLRTETVVSGGPYRHVRNPLYLANLLMAAGYGGLASRLGWCVIMAGLMLFQYRLILKEEALLLSGHGETFRSYLAAVPRLLPSWRARVAAGPLRPSWGQAFRAEAMFFGFAASLYCFAATLSMGWAAAILIVSLLSYAIPLRSRVISLRRR